MSISAMSVAIYHFFKQHRKAFHFMLVFSSIFFAYFGSRVEYEEDVAKLLPSSKGGSEKLVFNNLKVKDKLFLLFVPDSDSIGREELVAFSDGFVDSLKSKDSTHRVLADVLSRIDDEMMAEGMATLFSNAPLFLDSMDYSALDTLLTNEKIEAQMMENLMMFQSPAGMALGDMISNDPLAFRNVFIRKMSLFSGGEGSDYILLDKHFFSADSSFAIAFVSPNFQSFNSKDSEKLVRMIEDCMETFAKSHPGISVFYHGAPAQSVYNARQIKKDLSLTLAISISLICIIILLCYRNKSTLPYILLPVVYGTFFSLAIIYFTMGRMSLLALAIGAVVLGVALSYCLHVVTHYKYVGDPIRVLKDQTKPIFLGCLTTVGAFSALLFTQSELLQDFGIFASLALIGTTLFCVIFLPHFFNPENNRRSDKAFALLEKINSYPFERNKVLLGFILTVCVISFFSKRWVEFDSNLKNIGYNEPRVMKSVEMMDAQHAEGYGTTYYATTSADLDSALALNVKLHAVLDSMLECGSIASFSHVTSLLIPKEEQQRRIDMWHSYWTEDKLARVKSQLFSSASKCGFGQEMFAPFISNLEKKYEPISLLDANLIPKSVVSNLTEQTDGSYLVFTPVYMKNENVQAVSKTISDADSHFVVVDPFYYTKSLVMLIMEDFNVTLFISSLFVLAVLLISFRSVVLAILCFMPMSLSWYVVLGVMGIFGLKFNLINIVISTFIFGIGVDYSIFIMDGLLAAYRTRTQLLAYHKTAIFFSAVVLVIGVASLMFATHPAISSIGISTLIGMITVVLLSYTLQPLLFQLLISQPASQEKVPFSLMNLLRSNKDAFMHSFLGNYDYRGNDAEAGAREFLSQVSPISERHKYQEHARKVFVFGCDYGYWVYWMGLKMGDNAAIVGYEPDDYKVTIASNCYLKKDNMVFTTSFDVDDYDICVMERAPEGVEEEKLERVLEKAEFMVVKKSIPLKISKLQAYEKVDSDGSYVVYQKK